MHRSLAFAARTPPAARRLARSALGLLCALSLCAPGASAQAPKHQGDRAAPTGAAAHEREGELALREGRFRDAVRAFLAADHAEPSMVLLVRAFEAARAADDPLSIAQVAELMLSRAEISDEGRELARKAVAKASDRLTQLELVCRDTRCAFEVDGGEAHEGIAYFMPGAHRVQLRGRPETAIGVECAARAICRLTLPASHPVPLAVAAPPASAPAPLGAPRASGPARAAPVVSEHALRKAEERGEERGGAPRSRLPWIVLAGAGAGTAGFGALATLVGLQAVHARELHGTERYDADHVRALARRADYYALGAVLCAGAALATTIWWLDWGKKGRTEVIVGATRAAAVHRF
jgi:hypothetical protein